MPAAAAADFSDAGASPTIVAAAGWLVPGAGYWVLGQRSRAVVVGVTIVCIWVLGLAIGGVRVIEVPKFDEHGRYIPYPYAAEGRPTMRAGGATVFEEIRAKPWSIAQVLAGPVALVSGAASIYASRPDADTGEPRAAVPHSRMWEIPVLYTAVAGMLNLLAIIDASHRARRGEAA